MEHGDREMADSLTPTECVVRPPKSFKSTEDERRVGVPSLRSVHLPSIPRAEIDNAGVNNAEERRREGIQTSKSEEDEREEAFIYDLCLSRGLQTP